MQTIRITINNRPILVKVRKPSPVQIGISKVGPAGKDASRLLKTAGQELSALRIVTVDPAGDPIYADHTNLDHAGAVLGITINAAPIEGQVIIQTYGEIIEPSWNWEAGTAFFLGAEGALLTAPPATGFVQCVGFAVNPTTLFLQIQQPVIR